LFTRNAASRDSGDSSLAREASSGRRRIRKKPLTTMMMAMKIMNIMASFLSSPNACTDDTTPDRVRNVPTMVSRNVRMMSVKFQTFIIPRRSWIMVEWKNAVAVNHGTAAAFSTGSQAQKPPQPSSS